MLTNKQFVLTGPVIDSSYQPGLLPSHHKDRLLHGSAMMTSNYPLLHATYHFRRNSAASCLVVDQVELTNLTSRFAERKPAEALSNSKGLCGVDNLPWVVDRWAWDR